MWTRRTSTYRSSHAAWTGHARPSHARTFATALAQARQRAGALWGAMGGHGAPALLLLAVLLVGGPIIWCAAMQHAQKGSPQNQAAQDGAQPEDTGERLVFDVYQAAPAATKQETVHVQADASGTPEKVSVTSVLKQVGDALFVTDRSNLEAILNTQGNERFLQEGTELLWDNLGNDITYTGDSTQKPPVGVELRYFLDGTELSPQEIAGKSGKVTIRFDYTQSQDMQQPVYTFSTFVMLDHAHFSDIEATNGTCTSMGDLELVSGYALPAFKSLTGLSELDSSESLGVPEYLEIRAQATDFQLDYTTTIVTSGLFKQVKDDALTDGADMVAAIRELESSSAQILGGISTIDQGANAFGEALAQYTDGAQQLDQGASALTQGVSSLRSGGDDLLAGTHQLADGLARLDAALSAVDTQSLDRIDGTLGETLPKVKSLVEEAQEADLTALETQIREALDSFEPLVERLASVSCQVQLSICVLEQLYGKLGELEQEILALKEQGADTTALEALVASAYQDLDEALGFLHAINTAEHDYDLGAVRQSIQKLDTWVEQLKGLVEPLEDLPELGGLVEQINELKSAVSALSNGASRLEEGVELYTTGIADLDAGARRLRDGASQLGESGGELRQGYESLSTGIGTLLSSYTLFDEQGIQELSQLGNDELADVFSQMRRLKTVDERLQSFSGVADGTATDVKYLIETAGI